MIKFLRSSTLYLLSIIRQSKDSFVFCNCVAVFLDLTKCEYQFLRAHCRSPINFQYENLQLDIQYEVMIYRFQEIKVVVKYPGFNVLISFEIFIEITLAMTLDFYENVDVFLIFFSTIVISQKLIKIYM